MSALDQERWDEMRFELLIELAQTVRELESDGELSPCLARFVEACARAYDRPPPSYTVYQRLRSFKAGQWLLVRRILAPIARSDAQAGSTSGGEKSARMRATLDQASDWLEAANLRRDAEQSDALEVQLSVLQQMLLESEP